MRSTSWLAIAVAVSCALGACSRAQNPRSFNGAWDENRARGIALEISRVWQYSPDKDFQGTSVADLQRKVYAVLPFDRVGTPRWLVLLAMIPSSQTCHACAPVTGGVIFARKNDGWEAVYDQSHIVDVGAYGKPPTAREQKLGPGTPAVAFEINGMAQGYEATNLTLVAEVQDQLRQVLSIDTYASNEAAGLPEEQTFTWHATVEASSSSKSEFPDLIVKCSGTKPTGEAQQIRPCSETSIYRFNDGAYRLVK
jgi:hypothetical protein